MKESSEAMVMSTENLEDAIQYVKNNKNKEDFIILNDIDLIVYDSSIV